MEATEYAALTVLAATRGAADVAWDIAYKTRNNKYLDTKKELLPEWKKIYKPRTPKTGMSELLRTLDTKLGTKNYGSRMYANGKYGPVKAKQAAISAATKQDPAKGAEALAKAFVEWSRTLAAAKVEIEKIYKKHKWLPKEDEFLKDLMEDFKHESTFFVKLAEDQKNPLFFWTYVAPVAPQAAPAKVGDGKNIYSKSPR